MLILDRLLTGLHDACAAFLDKRKGAGEYSMADMDKLVALCKRGRTERPSESDPKPRPLDASHLPANPGAGRSRRRKH